ncbi:MAG: KTSC domain-containing protein [Clostridia bacterium]|nr:KTSC domain-containing protein [Clostridia bacterium]MBQ8872590.1 KTSC domain-containing protein [Clostridia bacterium]
MRMLSIDSSNIEYVGYDERLQFLHIQFVNGTTYEYYDVPKRIYIDLITASSVGKYFHKYIKDVYRCSKI